MNSCCFFQYDLILSNFLLNHYYEYHLDRCHYLRDQELRSSVSDRLKKGLDASSLLLVCWAWTKLFLVSSFDIAMTSLQFNWLPLRKKCVMRYFLRSCILLNKYSNKVGNNEILIMHPSLIFVGENSRIQKRGGENFKYQKSSNHQQFIISIHSNTL